MHGVPCHQNSRSEIAETPASSAPAPSPPLPATHHSSGNPTPPVALLPPGLPRQPIEPPHRSQLQVKTPVVVVAGQARTLARASVQLVGQARRGAVDDAARLAASRPASEAPRGRSLAVAPSARGGGAGADYQDRAAGSCVVAGSRVDRQRERAPAAANLSGRRRDPCSDLQLARSEGTLVRALPSRCSSAATGKMLTAPAVLAPFRRAVPPLLPPPLSCQPNPARIGSHRSRQLSRASRTRLSRPRRHPRKPLSHPSLHRRPTPACPSSPSSRRRPTHSCRALLRHRRRRPSSTPTATGSRARPSSLRLLPRGRCRASEASPRCRLRRRCRAASLPRLAPLALPTPRPVVRLRRSARQGRPSLERSCRRPRSSATSAAPAADPASEGASRSAEAVGEATPVRALASVRDRGTTAGARSSPARAAAAAAASPTVHRALS